jgi:hypothetical protein
MLPAVNWIEYMCESVTSGLSPRWIAVAALERRFLLQLQHLQTPKEQLLTTPREHIKEQLSEFTELWIA